ncbi:MAG: hypothetical protein ACREVG_11935 [Burkholderiales bacterium]
MVTRRTFLVSLGVAFLVGGLGGLAAGAFGGYRWGFAVVLESALVKDAREIGARIATLNHLWLGEREQAIAKLEGGLDDILVGFDPEEPYRGLDGQTVAALAKAIDAAKAYRAAHPWPSTERHPRAEMVRNLFASDLYKPKGDGRKP